MNVGGVLMGAEKEDRIEITNSAMEVLKKIQVQNDMAGEAERLGLKSEEDVVNLVKEVRREIKQEKTENK
jgi:antitoxin PrlF